jgi:hypothetical protein
MTGNLAISSPGGGVLALQGNAGTSRIVSLATGTSTRWLVYATAEAESGANGGSNFYIGRCSDTGAYIDTPLNINRANGIVGFAQAPWSPTMATSDNSGRLATTQFVHNLFGQGVTSFNGRTGGVELNWNDVTGALGFAPVASFNGRTGVVGLGSPDVTNALGYTPVRQGGGPSQGWNQINIGWDGSRARLSVDGYDQQQILTFPRDFPYSLGNPGWMQFPSGLIVQWGSSGYSGGGGWVNFPLTFPNNCFSVAVSQFDSVIGSFDTCVRPQTNGFQVYSRDTSVNDVGWIAYGN